MTDYSSCAAALQEEVDLYQNFVFLSLGVTLICSIVRTTKTEYFHENPAVAAKVLYSFAILKIVLGIILIVMFPGCPQVCGNTCSTAGHHYIYPAIVFVVAFLWFNLGNRYRRLAKTQATASIVAGAEEGSGMVETVNKSKEFV